MLFFFRKDKFEQLKLNVIETMPNYLNFKLQKVKLG